MFVFAAGGADLQTSLARLARLMVNIERGERLYEWGLGSSPAPDPAPKPGFLSVTVPGQAAGSPPVVADFRPTVGIVFFFPAPEFSPATVARILKALLAQEDDAHLQGYLTVEAAPHVSLLHRGRAYSAAEVVGPRPPYEVGWQASTKHPTRHIQFGPDGCSELPPHFSVQGAFSWFLLPACALAAIRKVKTMAECNALVASVLFDPERDPRTAPEGPVYGDLSDHFRLKPCPVGTWRDRGKRMAFEWDETVALVYVGGRFEVAGRRLFGRLGRWAPPACPDWGGGAGPGGGGLAGLALSSEDLCAYCGLPLWGEFYAVAHPEFAPHRAPLCRWCCGCFPPAAWGRAVRAAHPRGPADAFAGRPGFEGLSLVLGARARRVASGGKVFFVMEGPDGEAAWLLDPDGRYSDPYVCLGRPELAEHRAYAVGFGRIAELRRPR